MTTESMRITRTSRLAAAALLFVTIGTVGTIGAPSSDRVALASPQTQAAGQPPATATATATAKPATAKPTTPAAVDGPEMLKALDVRAGLTVAEMGAGSGAMTLLVAREVGAAGRVYSSELGDGRIADLRKAIEQSGLANITIIDGDPLKTNLPDACCDALFMQNVYHHFENPTAMNASIFRAVKPGGRVAIQDFAPDTGEAARPEDRDEDAHHGVTPETVRRELEQAGFSALGQEPRGKRGFVVIVRKPTS